MTMYMHLRDGKTKDRASALALTSTSGSCTKYKAFATNFPNHVSWGTDDHVLEVAVGDTVFTGQRIGWAGNTGCGGAAAGLKDPADLEDGELPGQPKNWKGNVHLHTYWAVPHPTQADTWVYVDPYGVD